MITPLGGIDGLFLHLETRTMPMHVGSMHVYRLPRRFSGDFTTRLRHHLAERLHLSPVFTRRLAPMPLRLSNPAWIDADRVDLAYHVREIRLPAPGDVAALQDCVARLHAEPMDRDRPLWQFHVLQGLDLPGCIGFYGKVHHAALDGQAAVAMVQAFLDVHATPRAVAPPPPGPDHVPGPAPLVRAVAAHQLQETRRVFALLPALAKTGARFAAESVAARLRARFSSTPPAQGAPAPTGTRDTPMFAPRTPLNVTIGRARAFAGVRVPLRRVHAITEHLGGTVNDVVLMLCSGALRDHLAARNALPATTLFAAVPVSLRPAGDTAQNTQATMVRMPLATDIADPIERYAAIRSASASVKRGVGRFRDVIPADFPSVGMPWLLPPMATLVGRARLADRLPPLANLVISNVPGPRVPLYLAGARMLSYYPASIVTHGLALNITVESYVDDLFFGLVACRHAVPDLQAVADAIAAAEAELTALGRRAAAVARRTRSAR